MEFVPESSPTVVLALLFTCLLVLVAGIVFVHALITGRLGRAWRTALLAAVWIILYFTVMIAASLSSHDRILAAGEQKYFCEVDCHLAYSVIDVMRTKTVETAAGARAARGAFYVVKLRVWFDEQTVSPSRGDFPLVPDAREVVVITEDGRHYGLSREAEADLTRPLRPGESYETALLFDLPETARNPRLWIAATGWVSRLTIGHENSPLHRTVTFRLEPRV
jgi:hypothetical protein